MRYSLKNAHSGACIQGGSLNVSCSGCCDSIFLDKIKHYPLFQALPDSPYHLYILLGDQAKILTWVRYSGYGWMDGKEGKGREKRGRERRMDERQMDGWMDDE